MEKVATNIQAVRSQLVNRGLIFGAAIAPLALVLSSARIYIIGWHPIHVFHAGLAVLVIASAVFRKRLAYEVRVCSLLLPVFLVGATGLYVFGIAGSGVLLLFMFAIMTAIAFGTRAGLIACGVNMVVILSISIAVVTGAITYHFDAAKYMVSMAPWISKLAIFYLFAPVTIIVFGVIYKHLVVSLQNLQESEENYRLLIENIPSVAWIASEKGDVTYISQNVLKICGYSPEEICEAGSLIRLGKIHPEDVGLVRSSLEVMFELGQRFDVEYRIQTKAGDWIWVYDTGTVAFEKDGIRYAYGVLSDITDRKRAEDAQKTSEKKYRRLFDSANDAILLMKGERFVDCNDKAMEMFAATREQIVGQTLFRFSPELQLDGKESKQSAFEKIDAVLGGESMFFEWQHCRYDGTLFAAEVSLTDMDVERERYVLAIVRDISDRKAAEEEKKQIERQLQQTQRMEAIGTLAGGIAHDFNNILTSILGFTYLLEKDLPKEDAEARENVKSVMEAGLRAKELVRHILTFSRHSETKKVPVVPSLLVKEVVKLLRATLPAAIEIRADIRDDSTAVLADATQIHQVLMNLCVNAAHAMKDTGGVLNIRVDRVSFRADDLSEFHDIAPGDFIRLTVSDTGPGIPEEIIGRIFDPFFTTKKRGEGTGMGLSVVHGIVKDLAGSIQVKSGAGKGTTFQVVLPAHSGKDRAAAAPPAPQKGGGRILFVDDDESISTAAGKILKGLGYDVTTVSESPGALELFLSDPKAFDVVITDLDMPGMSGLELSRRMRRARSDLPIILCTGFSDNITRRELDDVGIYKLMMKPVILSELVEHVKQAV